MSQLMLWALLLLGCVEIVDNPNVDPAETGTSEGESGESEAQQLELEIKATGVKQFEFSWEPVAGMETYELWRSYDEGENWESLGGAQTMPTTVHSVALHLRPLYKLSACGSDCVESEPVSAETDTITKAMGCFDRNDAMACVDGGEEDDKFGMNVSVALSGDGQTLAVGAPSEVGSEGGAVYVFTDDEGWAKQPPIEAPNGDESFGRSVALSEDGKILAVGAPDSEVVYMYTWGELVEQWETPADVSVAPDEDNHFGRSIALSDDGMTLAVGAPGTSSYAGATHVFVRNGNQWVQEAHLKASDSADYLLFGTDVALSGDGGTLAVGAPQDFFEWGPPNPPPAAGHGAVYVYRDGQWADDPQKLEAERPGSGFGGQVALSEGEDEGPRTLAIGAALFGGVYRYTRDPEDWGNEQVLHNFVDNHVNQDDRLGRGLALSRDGKTLVVGATREDSNTTGVGATPSDSFCADTDTDECGNDLAPDSGVAYVLHPISYVTQSSQPDPDPPPGPRWLPRTYVKPNSISAESGFGWSLALSGDGETLAVGTQSSGRVYLY